MDLTKFSDRDLDALLRKDIKSLSDEGLRLLLQAQEPQYERAVAAPPKSTLLGEIARGARQLGSSTLTGAQAVVGSPEEAARAGIERSKAISEQYGEGPSLARVMRTYEEQGLFPAIGRGISDIPQAIAGQVPQLGAALGGGRLGAMAGAAVAGPPGALIGGGLGAVAAMLPQFLGANVERQAQEQIEAKRPVNIDVGSAAGAAAGQAALEAAGGALALGKTLVKKTLGVTDDAALVLARNQQELVRTAEQSLMAATGRGAARGVAAEMPVEVAQSVIERAQAGLELTSPDAYKEYGEAMYLAGMVGGALGGVGGVSSRAEARRQQAEAAPPEQPPGSAAPPSAAPPALPAPEAGKPIAAPPTEPPPDTTAPPTDTTTPPPTPPTPPTDVKPVKPETFEGYETGLPEESKNILQDVQNRNRKNDELIRQMQNIASAPDYDRLKVTPDFGTGAPVVMTDIKLDDSQFGNISRATTVDGTKIPVRYAVVEADQLLTSNTADGSTIPQYSDPDVAGIRAIAGNGRIAGLTEAYRRGTAENYKNGMLEDADHGISPDVIRNMKNPVLVRVMPKSFVTPDIGERSNVSPVAELNPVERAKTDGKRIDVGGLSFNEDGSISDKALREFIEAMPDNERTALREDDGRPNSTAVRRLNNAIFWQAYNSEPLIRLYSAAIDSESKTIMAALAQAASKFARLADAGEYDLRPTIINAAEQAINARRRDIPLSDFVKQGDIGIDANTQKVLQMFADNIRSGKRMGEKLGELADLAYAQTQVAPDMFGEAPKRPVNELFDSLVTGEEGKPSEPSEPKPQRVEFRIDKPEGQIAKEIEGLSILNLSQWAINNAPNDAAKVIAQAVNKKILDLSKYGVLNTNVTVLHDNKRSTTDQALVLLRRVGGETGGVRYTMTFNALNKDKADRLTGTTYDTILHELLHVATVADIVVRPRSAQAQELKKLGQIVLQQMEKDIAKFRATGDINVLPKVLRATDDKGRTGLVDAKWREYATNPKEIVTWALTNKDYQDYVSKIKYRDKTVFNAIIEALRKLLNINAKYETVLDAVARNTNEIIETDISKLQEALAKPTKFFPEGVPLQEIKKVPPTVSEDVGDETVSTRAIPKSIAEAKGAAKAALQKRQKPPASSMAGVDQDLVDLAGPVFFPEKKTIVDKLDSMKDRFWQRLAQGLVDQFRTIKQYSDVGYIMARMSKTIDGALEGLLFHGQVFNDGGALNIKRNTKGLLEIMKPLGDEVSRYQIWVALNREAMLPAEKRSKLDNMDELIKRRAEFADGTMPDGTKRIEVYEKVRDQLNQLNRSVLKVALDAGLIDSTANAIQRIENRTDIKQDEKDAMIAKLRANPIGYERFASDIWYIPFYREMEDGDTSKIMTASGLPNQKFSEKLEGGASPFGDLMENVLRNWSHILSASMKNQAGVQTLRDASDPQLNIQGAEPNLKAAYYMVDGVVYKRSNDEEVGDVQPWMTTSDGKNVTKVMVDGQPMYYKVLDPLLLESISAIGYLGPQSKFVSVARDFKNLLQYGVTISPAFKVRNLVRDSVSAMAISDLKKNPWYNVSTGWASAQPGSPDYISALSGGAIFNFGSIVEGDQAKLVRRLIERGVPKDTILDTPGLVKTKLKEAWDKYQEWGNKSEAANRMALYTQLRDQGMSHLEASYKARDLLDFSMQGAWPAFRLLTQTVPFLNARAQGLYKLGRDGIIPTTRVFYNTLTGKPVDQTDQQKAQSFTIVTGAVTLATLALYFAFQDDEDFKARDDWDRDNFWWFKLPGMDQAFRVPKPFEIGAFATLVERSIEQIADKGAEGKQFKDSLNRMIVDTFAFNLPQFMRPMVDLYANKDSFTGAPIESAGLERLSKAERVTENTSPLAQALGGVANVFLPEKMEVSPVQMDYMIKSYLGWLGGSIAWASKFAVEPFRDGSYPSEKWTDIASVGFIKSLPANQSKYVTSFYEYNQKISQAYADMRHYAALGQTEKVSEILADKGDMVSLAKVYDHTSKTMANIRKQIQIVSADTGMSGSEKREQVDRLKQLISMYAKQAEDIRKSTKKD